jgi:hypothetical protein
MKEVTVTIKLRLLGEQPSCDWIYESIAEQLDYQAGELILEYYDDEPVVKIGLTDAT